MLINHVLTTDAQSAIFDAIFGYFEEHAPPSMKFVVSTKPLATADVHHYHRPHLENKLTNRAITTVHHDLYDPDRWLSIDKFVPRYLEARKVVCLNQGQRDELAKHGVARTSVIPHGYNDRVLRIRKNHREAHLDSKVTLGFFSKRYDRRFKGEAYLSELAKRLHPDLFEFLLVGRGRHKTAEDLLSIGYEVTVFEHLPYTLFQSLYEQIDALLMCSLFEGGPANIPEALATGTPLLATSVGMVPDFLRDGVNGFILSGDPDRDADRIATLADPSTGALSNLSDGARALASSVPTWDDVVGRYCAVYEEVVAGAH